MLFPNTSLWRIRFYTSPGPDSKIFTAGNRVHSPIARVSIPRATVHLRGKMLINYLFLWGNVSTSGGESWIKEGLKWLSFCGAHEHRGRGFTGEALRFDFKVFSQSSSSSRCCLASSHTFSRESPSVKACARRFWIMQKCHWSSSLRCIVFISCSYIRHWT